MEKLYAEATRMWNVPAIRVVAPYYDHPAFIASCANAARPVLAELKPDHVIMSFHGLPERHVVKADESGGRHCLRAQSCCNRIVPENRNCYRAQCFATARLIARELELPEDVYEVAFQSRLGRSPWIRPYTDLRIRELAHAGLKRLAVLSPSFTADCLETLEEIGLRAAEDFRAHGGTELRLVPSLNSRDDWTAAILRIIQDAEFEPSAIGGNVPQSPEVQRESGGRRRHACEASRRS